MAPLPPRRKTKINGYLLVDTMAFCVSFVLFPCHKPFTLHVQYVYSTIQHYVHYFGGVGYRTPGDQYLDTMCLIIQCHSVPDCDILVRIWIRIVLFHQWPPRCAKKICLESIFVYYLLKVHLHHSLQIKKSYRSHKTVGKKVCFYFFCLIMGGSGSGSVSLTYRSGSRSGRPKDLRILRIRIRKMA
jgi:hypothetical protein